MATNLVISTSDNLKQQQVSTGALMLGAGLAIASMILVPAAAMRLGLGASLTGALRIALMKASTRATRSTRNESAATSIGTSCH